MEARSMASCWGDSSASRRQGSWEEMGHTQKKSWSVSIRDHAWCLAFLPWAQVGRRCPNIGSPGLGSVEQRAEHDRDGDRGSQEAQI